MTPATLAPRMKLSGPGVRGDDPLLGGVRIQQFDILGMAVDLGGPILDLSMGPYRWPVSLPSLLVTMLWFLACMNIWNLIDGMDGLASGVGLLVSGTLTLVAIHHQNVGVAIMAAALAGAWPGSSSTTGILRASFSGTAGACSSVS